MFEQATLSSGPTAKRLWTTILGITGQATLVIFLILAPMIWPEVLPAAKSAVTMIGPPTGYRKQPPPGTASVQPTQSRAGAKSLLPWQPPRQPSSVPDKVAMIGAEPEFSFSGGSPTGGPYVPGGIPGPPGIVGSIGTDRAIPPPPEPAPIKPVATTVPSRVVATSELDQAQILRRVDPVYPELARRARISGTVELRGIIGTDGHIRELKVLHGHPLLIKAAIDAISQWVYKPTRLSGQPVEVDAPISVIFRLN